MFLDDINYYIPSLACIHCSFYHLGNDLLETDFKHGLALYNLDHSFKD